VTCAELEELKASGADWAEEILVGFRLAAERSPKLAVWVKKHPVFTAQVVAQTDAEPHYATDYERLFADVARPVLAAKGFDRRRFARFVRPLIRVRTQGRARRTALQHSSRGSPGRPSPDDGPEPSAALAEASA
jgi:hypothetical protein